MQSGTGLAHSAKVVGMVGIDRASYGLSTLVTIVAEFGNSRRFRRHSPNWATIVASVDTGQAITR